MICRRARPLHRCLAALALGSTLAGCSASPAPAPRPRTAAAPAPADPGAAPAASWPFEGTHLPAPPAQRLPWSPRPTGLPAGLVRAAASLFAQGVADPRGLEYRQVEITTTTDISEPPAALGIRAWVLPEAEGGPRFGVAWNGLVYPLRAVGAPADLRADVAAILREDARMRASFPAAVLGDVFTRSLQPRAERFDLDPREVHPLQVALLLRAGEDKLAHQLWQTWAAGLPPRVLPEAARLLRDPYPVLAGDWLYALHQRALWAHVRGDGALALASLRALDRALPAVAAEVARRGGQEALEGRAFVEVRGMLPALLADEERRARAGADTARANPALRADPAARVAALIEDLDQISGPFFGRSPGRALEGDPRVQALVREGAAAVEPLLRAVEGDERLTRAVWLHEHGLVLVRAHSAAAVAVSLIVEEAPAWSFDVDAAARRELAAELRASWARWQGVPLPERWARVLADDGAGARAWLDAAARIAQPARDATPPQSVPWSLRVLLREGGPGALRGEPLRKRARPSIAELMARRAEELARPDPADRIAAPRGACFMAALLGLWDPAAGARALGKQVERARALMSARPAEPPLPSLLAECVAALTVMRAQGGDARALDEYAAWIRGLPAAALEDDPWVLFAPMWRNPRHPAVAAAGRAVFGRPGAPWADRLRRGALSDLLEAQMARVPGFQEIVLGALRDAARVGWIEIVDAASYRYELDAAEIPDEYGGKVAAGDPHTPPPGARMPLRACDLVAAQIGKIAGAPAFLLHWAEPRRDEALAAIRAFVQAPPR